MSTEPEKTEKTDRLAADKAAVDAKPKEHAKEATGVNPAAGNEVTPSDAMKKQEGFKDLKK